MATKRSIRSGTPGRSTVVAPHRRDLWCAAAALVMVAWAARHAAEAAPNDKDLTPTARELSDRGLGHYQRGELDAAIESFMGAYALSNNAGLLFNIAQAFRLKGDCASAKDYYQSYLAAGPGSALRPSVERRLDEMNTCLTASATAAAAKGRLAVAPSPGTPTNGELRVVVGASPARRATVWTLRGSAAALMASSVTFGLLAWDARRDVDGTSLQRPAWEANERFKLDTTLAWSFGVASLACGLISVLRGEALVNDRAWLAVMVVAVLPACSVDLSQKTSCKTTGDCLGGYLCISDRCVAADGGSGAAAPLGDASAPDSTADRPASDAAPDSIGSQPSLLPQTVLWLDAAKGFRVTDNPPSAEWLDQSGNQNHARQTMATSIPAFTPDAVGRLPTITFDGQKTFLKVDDAPSLRFGTGDYAVVVIARSTNRSVEHEPIFFHKREGADPNRGHALYLHTLLGQSGGQIVAQDDLNRRATSTRAYNDGRFHLFVMRRAGTTLTLRIDAETIGWAAEAPSVNVDAPGRALMIGDQGYDPGTQPLDGDVAELIAVRGPVRDQQLMELEAGLMLKYGLRSAPEPAALLPSAADGLVLWLDAESGVTSADASFEWRDRSGMHNDAVAPFGSGVPRLVQAWPDLPAAVALSGDNQFLMLPPGMRDFTAGLSAFVVVETQPPIVASEYSTTRFIDFANQPGEKDGVVIERAGIEGSALEYVTCNEDGACYHPGVAADAVHSYTRQLLEVHATGGSPRRGKRRPLPPKWRHRGVRLRQGPRGGDPPIASHRTHQRRVGRRADRPGSPRLRRRDRALQSPSRRRRAARRGALPTRPLEAALTRQPARRNALPASGYWQVIVIALATAGIPSR